MSLNKTKIEWTDYTWNPMVGCLHGCYYCYAKKINDRFGYIEKWNEPKFFPDRLKIKFPDKPSKIFVGSMSDVMGNWIYSEWIEKIIEVAKANPKHIFQFLTKNPKRYKDFVFPVNCWLGVTITSNKDHQRVLDFYKAVAAKNNFLFVSCEPLLGSCNDIDFDGFNLVVIGAMTGVGAIKPDKKWINDIRHFNTFYKKNL